VSLVNRRRGCLPSRERVKVLFREIAGRYGADASLLSGPSQVAFLVAARAEIAVEMRRWGCSYATIGKFLNRHHTTVMNLVLPSCDRPAALEVFPYNPKEPDFSGEWAI
jgi:hypothetical protein